MPTNQGEAVSQCQEAMVAFGVLIRKRPREGIQGKDSLANRIEPDPRCSESARSTTPQHREELAGQPGDRQHGIEVPIDLYKSYLVV